MAKYGPSKKEHQFRVAASLLGLCMLVASLWRMEGLGPGALEAIIFGGAFLIGTVIWSGWKPYNRDFGEDV